MKKLLFILFTAILFTSQAQTYLKVGETAPSLNGCRWMLGDAVTELKKGKAYALIFGASWSGRYLSMIPELAAFANSQKQQVEMLTFFIHEQIGKGTLPYGEYLEKTLKKYYNFNCAVAIDDLSAALQHAWLIDDVKQDALPVFIVVDRDGKIAWTGNELASLEEAVKEVNSNSYSITQMIEKAHAADKAELPFDFSKPYLVHNNGGPGEGFVFRSLLAPYDGKIPAPYYPEFIQEVTGIVFDSAINAGRVQMFGAPLLAMYYTAYSDTFNNNIMGRNPITNLYPDTIVRPHMRSTYGEWWHKPIVEVSDLAPFEFNWKSPANRFNYSLQVPAVLGTAAFLKEVMQRDLTSYFGYGVSIETRTMPYWKLSAPDKAKALKLLATKTKGKEYDVDDTETPFHFKNAIMRDIITMMGYFYGYLSHDYGKVPKQEQGAFIDETGITEYIAFEFDPEMSFEEFRNYLKSKGLLLTREYKPMKVVVIRDPKN